MKANVKKNTNNPLADKGLSVVPLTGTYFIVNNKIDRMTVAMYRLIVDGVLHDASPVELATEIKDFWECEAETLYENRQLSHREFERCMTRIAYVIKRSQADLGVTE